VTVNNLVDAHKLVQTDFDKKSYMTHIKDYMARLLKKLVSKINQPWGTGRHKTLATPTTAGPLPTTGVAPPSGVLVPLIPLPHQLVPMVVTTDMVLAKVATMDMELAKGVTLDMEVAKVAAGQSSSLCQSPFPDPNSRH
jgi:hypothetical protein